MKRRRDPFPALIAWLALASAAVAQAPTAPPAPMPPAPAPASAPADPVATARAEIAAAYDQLGAAYQRGDLKAFFSWFAPDYQVTGTDGKTMTLSQAEKQARQDRGQITSFHNRWTLGPMTPAPDGAGGETLVMTMHSEGTGQKRILFFMAHGSFVDDTQLRDEWVDTPQGWRLTRRQVLYDHLQSHPG